MENIPDAFVIGIYGVNIVIAILLVVVSKHREGWISALLGWGCVLILYLKWVMLPVK